MKTLFLLLASFFATLMMAQTVRFEPQWKVGDTYQLNITTISKEYLEGEEPVTDERSTFSANPVLTVSGMENNLWMLTLKYESLMIGLLGELMELENILLPEETFTLRYRYSPEDGSYECLNCDEVESALSDMLSALSMMLGDDFSGLLMKPMLESLKLAITDSGFLTKMYAEFLEELNHVFFKDLPVNATHETTIREENPLSAGSHVPVKVLTSVEKYEKGDSEAIVYILKEFDIDNWLKSLEPFVAKILLAKSQSGGNPGEAQMDSARVEAKRILESKKMSAQTKTTITFNPQTGWPYLVVTQKENSVGMGELGNIKTETVTTTKFVKVN